MEAKDSSEIEQIFQYKFKDNSLLQEALRHSSYVNELGESELRDNERLEFLGDAVLNLAVGHILMRRYPDLKEGDLSRSRANLVNESQLAKMARSFDLGQYILLGKGEIRFGVCGILLEPLPASFRLRVRPDRDSSPTVDRLDARAGRGPLPWSAIRFGSPD